MSNQLQQQQQQQQRQQQQQQQNDSAVAVARFYPSSNYFQEPKSNVPTTSTSVYDQPMTLQSQSDVEQEMVDAVAAFSSTSLPPLSQLLPSSSTTSTSSKTSIQQSVSTTQCNKTLNNKTADTTDATTQKVYSHSTVNNNNNNDHLTMPPTSTTSHSVTGPSNMYQPSPTVMSHPKMSSNHTDMYYRSPVIATAVTPPNATTNDSYYLTMHGYNPTTNQMVSQSTTSNNNVNSLQFSSAMMTSSSISAPPPTVQSHPPSFTTTTDDTQQMRHPTTRYRYSQQSIYHPHPYSYSNTHSHNHQHLPSPPSSYDQYPMEQQQNQKVFSFVSLPGVNQKKRPRRKYHEVERLYHCNYMGCSKSYGTLNHLNAHVQMQDHGPKRHPSEFKELRKMWRKQKRENQGKHKKNGSSNTSSSQQMEQQQRQQETRPSPHHSVQSHHHIPLPSIPSHQVQPMIHHSLPPPPPLPTVLYPPPSNHWMAAIPSQHHHPTALSNMTQLHQPQHTSHPHHQSAAAAGFTTNNMNY